MSGGVRARVVNISNPVNKNINVRDAVNLGNFLSFQMKIRLPMTPLSTVEMAHGSAVNPPRLNLYAAEIIPAGIPTNGPPKRPPIMTIMHLTLAGVPLMSR